MSVKRKYILATYEILAEEGVEGVTVRKVAARVGVSVSALYRHFPDIDQLIAIASMRFLSDYSSDALILSQVDLDPLVLNLQLWECFAFYMFRNAPILENLFFGKGNQGAIKNPTIEYYKEFPEEIEHLSGYMSMMLTGQNLIERDSVLLQKAADIGMIEQESVEYLSKLDSYVFQGMLASIRFTYKDEDVLRKTTHEFLQLVVRNYQMMLRPGYKLVITKPLKRSLAIDTYYKGTKTYQLARTDAVTPY